MGKIVKKKVRTVFYEYHIPKRSNGMEYLQNISDTEPSKTEFWSGSKWTKRIIKRNLDEDEYFVTSDQYSSYGKGGPIYNNQIIKFKNNEDLEKFSSLAEKNKCLSEKINEINKEISENNKTMDSLGVDQTKLY